MNVRARLLMSLPFVCGRSAAQLAAHWAQTSQLLASGAAVLRNFYADRERAFAAQGNVARE